MPTEVLYLLEHWGAYPTAAQLAAYEAELAAEAEDEAHSNAYRQDGGID